MRSKRQPSRNELRQAVYKLAEPDLKLTAWQTLRRFNYLEIVWIVDHLRRVEFASCEKAAKSEWDPNDKRIIRVGWTFFQFAPPKVKRAIFVLEFFDLLNESVKQEDIKTRFSSFIDEIRTWMRYKNLIDAGARTSELLAWKG